MSPSPELIVPDAPRSRRRGLIHPGRPVAGFRTASWRNAGKARLLFFFFFLNTCHLLVENLSLTTSASCIPLSYSLPIVHFVTVCFTLDHLLSHSHSPTSIKSLSPIPLSLAAFLSLVNSSFSQLSPLSAYSLDLPRVLSLHLDCCSSSCCLALSHYLPL